MPNVFTGEGEYAMASLLFGAPHREAGASRVWAATMKRGSTRYAPICMTFSAELGRGEFRDIATRWILCTAVEL